MNSVNPKLAVFVDESGIHRQDGQSTTALVYIQIEHVDILDKVILEIEKTLHIESFHWSKHIWKIRQEFLEAVIKEDFEVKVFILHNPIVAGKLEKAWRHLLVEKRIHTIIIDGKKSRRYAQNLKSVLRESGISIKRIRTGNDRSFPGLRLADLFAGLTRAYVEDPKNEKAKQLYEIAKNKITIQLMDGQVPASLF